jgi:GNAT superfamily N-acetyltransferase
VTPPVLTDGFRHRIERASAAFHTRWLELVRDMPGNPSDVEVRRFGDAVVGTMCRRSPQIDWMQHVSGVTPDNVSLVPKVAAWYHGHHIRPRFEIAPTSDFGPLSEALADVNARQTGFIDALWGRAEAPAAAPPTDVQIRVVEAGSPEASVFARVHLAGHEVPDDSFPEHWAAVAAWAAEPEWWCYLAELDGQPVATAALAVDDGVGYLANAATVPSARGKGVHQALLHRRLLDACAAGCDLFVSLALPGGSSHRNIERAGLGVAYTKVTWTVV